MILCTLICVLLYVVEYIGDKGATGKACLNSVAYVAGALMGAGYVSCHLFFVF